MRGAPQRRRGSALALCGVSVVVALVGVDGDAAPATPSSEAETAEAIGVGVLPMARDGDLDDAAAALLSTRFDATLSHAVDHSVSVGGGDATPCVDADCRTRLATAANLEFMVQLRAQAEDTTYELTATLFDGRTGQPIATVSDRCDICGIEDVARIAADHAVAIAGRIARMNLPARVVVRTVPPGATVLVDGRTRGTSPVMVDVSRGGHRLEIRLDGHTGHRRAFEAVAGGEEIVDVRLDPVARSTGPAPRRRWRILGGVGTGLGLAALGVGIPLLVIDDRPVQRRCSGDDVDFRGTCRFRHETLTAGIVTVASGVLVLGLSIGALVYGTRPQRRRVTVVPTPGGAGVLGRF